MNREVHVRIIGHVPDYEGKQLLPGLELEVTLETARGWISLGKAEVISAPDTAKGKQASASKPVVRGG